MRRLSPAGATSRSHGAWRCELPRYGILIQSLDATSNWVTAHIAHDNEG